MTEEPEEVDDERLGFWSTWRRLYVFIIVYAILQIVLLYLFTRIFNHP
jgi:asparagine N-glycosylation enzyme membrane subunit Stt3